MKTFNQYVKYLVLAFIAVIMTACSGGACAPNQPTNIYTFANGSTLKGPTSLGMTMGVNESAQYTLSGGTLPFAVKLSTDNPLVSVSAQNQTVSASSSCTLCGAFTPEVLDLNQYQNESNSTLIVRASGNLSPGTYILNLFAEGVNGTNFPKTQIGIITIIVVANPNGVLVADKNPVLIDVGNQTQELVITNVGSKAVSNINLPSVTAPLTEVATTCGSSLAIGESCVYTINVDYQSGGVTAGNQDLVFSYNNGNTDTNLTVPVIWSASEYAYVANGSDVAKCITESNGTFSNCTSATSTNTPNWYPQAIKTQYINNEKYVYVLSSGSVFQCTINNDGTGALTCSPAFVNPQDEIGGLDINFALVNNSWIAYIVGGDAEQSVQMCPVNSNGTFGACNNAIDDSNLEISGVTIASFGGKQYAYLSDFTYSHYAWKCPVNSDGTFSDGTLNEGNPGGCVNLSDYSSTLQYEPYQIKFKTLPSGTYAYVTGYIGRPFYDNNTQQCAVDTNTGNFGTCVNMPNATPPSPWSDTAVINFYSFGGNDYAYVTDQSNVYQCSFDTTSGALSNCNSFTPTYSSPITSWSPYEFIFGK